MPMQPALARVGPGTEIARLGVLPALGQSHVRSGPQETGKLMMALTVC